ncbi:MAG: class I adenylate-forming enzyme family protein [Chloroflexota bacterium]
MNANISTFAGFLAGHFGGEPALASGLTGGLTYADLSRIAAELCADLRARGLAASDRVALVASQDGPGMAALLASAAALTTMPLREQVAAAEARSLLERAAIRALIAPDSRAAGARAAAAELGMPVLDLRWSGDSRRFAIDGPAPGPPAPASQPLPADHALLLTTSGTTGRPRIVPWTQSSSMASIRAAIIDAGLGPGSRTVLTLPLALAYGAIEVFVGLAGGSLIIIPEQGGSMPIHDLIRLYQPNWLSLSAARFAEFAEWARLQPGDRPTCLRWVASGGGALREDHRTAAETILGCPVLDMFGASEAGPMARQHFPVEALAGSVGRPLIDLRIAGDDGAVLPAGRPGHVQVRGDTVFPGYLDDPEATARAFTPDGWLRVSDRAILHPDGSLSVLGRGDDLINRGGDKIDPIEIEVVFRDHPAVRECAVFAIPHPRFGQEAAAAVVLRPGASLSHRDLRRWLLDRLSAPKLPRRIAFVDDLPRTPTGKIRRAALPSLLQDDRSDHPPGE